MRSDEFISILSQPSDGEDKFEERRKGVPLGIDMSGAVVLSQKRTRALTARHTCVTGGNRRQFIKRLVLTLSALYEKDGACFILLSPCDDYGELLRLKNIDLTAPYLRTREDFDLMKSTVVELLRMREAGEGYPTLFLVADGLEELDGFNAQNDFAEYRELFELAAHKEGVEVITGVDVMKSIFSGQPSAFVEMGNCLVTTREGGKADVTYVLDDGSLAAPIMMYYPDAPSITETVILFNCIARDEEDGRA